MKNMSIERIFKVNNDTFYIGDDVVVEYDKNEKPTTIFGNISEIHAGTIVINRFTNSNPIHINVFDDLIRIKHNKIRRGIGLGYKKVCTDIWENE